MRYKIISCRNIRHGNAKFPIHVHDTHEVIISGFIQGLHSQIRTRRYHPDDFPLELKVTYTIEHAMARDKAAIQSMFNRGSGRIYKLPDYIRATSDFETKVDKFTGGRYDKNIYTPQFMSSSELMNLSGAKGYQTYKIPAGETPTNTGNPETTFVPSFIVPDNQAVSMALGNPEKNAFLMNKDVRSVIAAPLTAQKMMD